MYNMVFFVSCISCFTSAVFETDSNLKTLLVGVVIL